MCLQGVSRVGARLEVDRRAGRRHSSPGNRKVLPQESTVEEGETVGRTGIVKMNVTSVVIPRAIEVK